MDYYVVVWLITVCYMPALVSSLKARWMRHQRHYGGTAPKVLKVWQKTNTEGVARL